MAFRPYVAQDVDGVLNRYVEGTPELDPRLLGNLKRLLEKSHADVVLSTQWRKHPQHRQRLLGALRQWPG